MRRARARLAVALIAWVTLGVAPAAAQESIAEARKLYQSADYDAALGVLDRLTKNDPVAAVDPDVAAYRVYCLLALGRTIDAQQGIATILRQSPQYRPSDTDTSPRIRTIFEDARRLLLPEIAKERYETAKAAYDRQEFQTAADQFRSLLALLDDPAVMGEDARSDMRTVVSGFVDLARAAAAAKSPPVAAVPPAVQPAAASPAAARGAAPGPAARGTSANGASAAKRVIFLPGTPGVIAPVAISKPLPPLPRGNAILVQKEYVGTLEIVVDEQGRVIDVTIKKGIHPQFDGRLVQSVRTWKFKPATKDGQPVSYRNTLDIKVVP
jgi:TonB family protein